MESMNDETAVTVAEEEERAGQKTYPAFRSSVVETMGEARRRWEIQRDEARARRD